MMLKPKMAAALPAAISQKDKAAPRGQARGAEGWEGASPARATLVTRKGAHHPRPDLRKPSDGRSNMLKPHDAGHESQAAINRSD
jgi:hypothetical protein